MRRKNDELNKEEKERYDNIVNRLAILDSRYKGNKIDFETYMRERSLLNYKKESILYKKTILKKNPKST